MILDPERRRAYYRAYRAKNRARIRKFDQAWRDRNIETARASLRRVQLRYREEREGDRNAWFTEMTTRIANTYAIPAHHIAAIAITPPAHSARRRLFHREGT
jgi:hypothetical protein